VARVDDFCMWSVLGVGISGRRVNFEGYTSGLKLCTRKQTFAQAISSRLVLTSARSVPSTSVSSQRSSAISDSSLFHHYRQISWTLTRMPTEVTFAPFKNEQQLPFALEKHCTSSSVPSSSPKMFLGPALHHPGLVPPTGPARLAECVPNKVLPNGIRNPWAPYEGQGYRPAAVGAENRAMNALTGWMGGAGGTGGMGGGAMGPIAHSYAGNPPTVLPSGSVAGGGSVFGGGSVIAGHRMDDGWDGSQGRAHMGHLPDPTSTAGRLGRSLPGTTGGGGWLHAPSSWQNHARLTPNLVTPSDAYPNSGAGGGMHLQPPVVHPHAHGASYSPRRPSISVPIDACHSCAGTGSEKGMGLHRSRSGSHKGSIGGHRRFASSPAAGSPLRPVDQVPLAHAHGFGREGGARLERVVSSSSNRSGKSRVCTECSACA
jgi:hypothetical protein